MAAALWEVAAMEDVSSGARASPPYIVGLLFDPRALDESLSAPNTDLSI